MLPTHGNPKLVPAAQEQGLVRGAAQAARRGPAGTPAPATAGGAPVAPAPAAAGSSRRGRRSGRACRSRSRPSACVLPPAASGSPAVCSSQSPSGETSTSNAPGTSTSVPSHSRHGFQPSRLSPKNCTGGSTGSTSMPRRSTTSSSTSPSIWNTSYTRTGRVSRPRCRRSRSRGWAMMPLMIEPPRSRGTRSGSRKSRAASTRSREVICRLRPYLMAPDGKAPDDLALEDDVDDQRRHGGEQQAGELQGRGAGVPAHEGGQGHHHGALVHALQEDHGREQVVPGGDEVEDDRRGRSRPGPWAARRSRPSGSSRSRRSRRPPAARR